MRTRDLGLSFLRSYAQLNPDWICVLHPLSYLIKKANFNALGEFTKKYKLKDAVVVSSAEFDETSPGKTYFPIVIALYQASKEGMDYQDIERFAFTTKEGRKFSLADMVSIGQFISKYPNQKLVQQQEAVAKFWTMRDINALKRSRTFVDETNDNTILIKREQLAYYCYVDVFKRFIGHIPYYFGNCDVFIDAAEFTKIQDDFMAFSAQNQPTLKQFLSSEVKNPLARIEPYFKSLLGIHYVE